MDLFVDEKDWNSNAENNTGGFRPSYGQDYVKYNTYLQKLLREVDNKIVSYIDMHGFSNNKELIIKTEDDSFHIDNNMIISRTQLAYLFIIF